MIDNQFCRLSFPLHGLIAHVIIFLHTIREDKEILRVRSGDVHGKIFS